MEGDLNDQSPLKMSWVFEVDELEEDFGMIIFLGRPDLSRGVRVYLVSDFWLAWSTARPVLFVQTCELDTGAGWESIPLRSSRARVSLSLDTVVVGEVDELGEDVG